MSIGNWLLSGSTLWLIGYVLLRISIPTAHVKYMIVPKWIFFMLGYPKIKGVPVYVVPVRDTYYSFVGIILVVLGVMFTTTAFPDGLSILIGFPSSMLIGLGICSWFYHRNPYQYEQKN